MNDQDKLNEAYRQRAQVVVALALAVQSLGGRVVYKPSDKDSDQWAVLYIEHNGVQVSYHYSEADEHMITRFAKDPHYVWDGTYHGRDLSKLCQLAAGGTNVTSILC